MLDLYGHIETTRNWGSGADHLDAAGQKNKRMEGPRGTNSACVVDFGSLGASWWLLADGADANEQGESAMKHFILLAGYGELKPWDQMSPEDQQASMEQHEAFGEACEAEAGVEMLGGEALEDGSVATTLRTSGGEMTVTDGPFAEATEHIGGYYVIEAPDLDTVIRLCQSLPPYDIEIRPIVDIG